MQVACALYEAAVAKYEAVLEMDPRNRAILRNCAFALYDLGRLQPDPSSKTARQLLEVIEISTPDTYACMCLLIHGYSGTQLPRTSASDVSKLSQ